MIQRYDKHCETSDHHKDAALRTHYYKVTFERIWREVERWTERDQEIVVATGNKERGELSYERKGKPSLFVVISIVSTSVLETAVDITCSTEDQRISGIYRVVKEEVLHIYKHLDAHFSRSGDPTKNERTTSV
ncbi:hypothetical protein [Bacillus fonticola]|uniref:hypothetical protein n=1 Tax=Bacillus fonticola TaxID=2728853 RepID=UPI0014747DB9|nr:hypothetical protein [Bacillus fonticola]